MSAVIGRWSSAQPFTLVAFVSLWGEIGDFSSAKSIVRELYLEHRCWRPHTWGLLSEAPFLRPTTFECSAWRMHSSQPVFFRSVVTKFGSDVRRRVTPITQCDDFVDVSSFRCLSPRVKKVIVVVSNSPALPTDSVSECCCLPPFSSFVAPDDGILHAPSLICPPGDRGKHP